MRPEVMRSQSETLQHWATEWERSAPVHVGTGHREVAFQMRRTAQFILQVAKDEPIDPTAEIETLPAPEIVSDVREDEAAGSGTPA